MEEYDDEGLTCHTAPGVVFTTMDDLKEHYRSDWHRYNLKRKVAGLPVVGNELFERVMQQAAAGKNGSGKVTGTSHLKRPEQLPRSVQKAQRFETWAENHQDEIEEAQEYARRLAAGEISDDEDAQFEDEERDEVGALGDDGDDDDWESMASDEAEEVLARMEKMAMEDQDDMVRTEPRTTRDGHEMPPREAPEFFALICIRLTPPFIPPPPPQPHRTTIPRATRTKGCSWTSPTPRFASRTTATSSSSPATTEPRNESDPESSAGTTGSGTGPRITGSPCSRSRRRTPSAGWCPCAWAAAEISSRGLTRTGDSTGCPRTSRRW